MNNPEQKLTKSNFTAGLQCEKRLFYEKFRKELRVITPADQLRFDEGNEVGRLARKLFPNGVLVRAPAWEQENAERQTTEFINGGKQTLFEAAFSAGNLCIRVDILHREIPRNAGDQMSLFAQEPSAWEVIEVKSGKSPDVGKDPKYDYLVDLAFQVLVMRRAGKQVDKACLLLLNREFEHRGSPPKPEELFSKVDVTALVEELLPKVEAKIVPLLEVISRPNEPEIEIGPQCADPYVCPFFQHCHPQPLPPDHLVNLPRVTLAQYRDLRAAGIAKIQDIPDAMIRHSIQQMVRDALRTNERRVDVAMRDELEKFRFPIHFVDFETVQYAVPQHIATSSYDYLPVQYSDHILFEDGKLDHREFIYVGFGDPRPEFITSLLEAVQGAGSIVVYSNFEEQRLKDLLRLNEASARELYDYFVDRIIDLYKIIKDYVYYPEFAGSFSIKKVLPAMVPSLSYDALTIREGEMATTMYRKMIDPECPPNEREEIKADLLEYCKLDTLAMVKLYEELKRLTMVAA